MVHLSVLAPVLDNRFGGIIANQFTFYKDDAIGHHFAMKKGFLAVLQCQQAGEAMGDESLVFGQSNIPSHRPYHTNLARK
jgi:hypothetical protein